MNALSLEAYDGLDGSRWGSSSDEPSHCRSRLYAADGRVLFCTLDAEHRHDPVDFRHGNGLTRWTTAEAVASWNAPRCIGCGERLPHTDSSGYHASCAGRDRYIADERDDIESEAAA